MAREFLFGLSVNLGEGSNNYAEYCGIIYSLILSNILKQLSIHIYTDSELVVTQVKGIVKIRNATLGSMVQRIHDLAYSFSAIDLNYIERELIATADHFAKHGAQMDEPYKLSFSLLDIMSNFKLT